LFVLLLFLYIFKGFCVVNAQVVRPPGGGKDISQPPAQPTCPPCGEPSPPADSGEYFYYCATDDAKAACVTNYGDFAGYDEMACYDLLKDCFKDVNGECDAETKKKVACCMTLITGCGSVSNGFSCSESEANPIRGAKLLAPSDTNVGYPNECMCDPGYQCKSWDDASTLCEGKIDRGEIGIPTQFKTKKTRCYDSGDDCKKACGPTPTPYSQTITECNANFFDPLNPSFDQYRMVPICIGTTTTETDPACLSEDKCWRADLPCGWRCLGLYYCDPIVRGCRFGFFLRPGIEDCSNKLALRGMPGKCFFTEDECRIDGCMGCTPQCDAPEDVCAEDVVSDGCGGTCTGTKVCTPSIISPPGFEVRNSSSILVMPDGSNRNHICEQIFWTDQAVSSKNVNYRFSMSSNNPIDAVMIGFNNADSDDLIISEAGIAGGDTMQNVTGVGVTVDFSSEQIGAGPFTANFTVKYGNNFPKNLNAIWVTAMDTEGRTMPWTYVNRTFKSWNCDVPLSGTLYDGSGETDASCATGTGFSVIANSDLNFTSLEYYRNIDLGVTETVGTNITSPAYFNYPGLVWGSTYNKKFNADLDADPGEMIFGTKDKGAGATSYKCPGTLLLNETYVSAYSTVPEIVVDYSTIVNPEPWYQVMGGGLAAKTTIKNSVPVTCYNDVTVPLCQPGISIDSSEVGSSNSGMVAAGSGIDKGCANCSYGIPNNWDVASNLVPAIYTYDYFFNEYFVKAGLGVSLAANAKMSDLGVGYTGVVFVNGNFNIDQDNALAVGTNDYLVIFVNGSITFEAGVNSSAGIFVAKDAINMIDSSDTQLQVEGLLYSIGSDVNFLRNFVTHSKNRKYPSTVIKYRPDYLFKLPSELVRVFSGWKQGT